MSPVFKSATAKQIIKEMVSNSGGGGSAIKKNGGRKRRDKQRSHTITGGSTGAVIEALQEHQNNMVRKLHFNMYFKELVDPRSPSILLDLLIH